MLQDIDFVGGSYLSLFQSFPLGTLERVLRYIIIFVGILVGTGLSYLSGKRDPHGYFKLFRVYLSIYFLLVTENVIFSKLNAIDVDFTLPFVITPFLLVLCYNYPGSARLPYEGYFPVSAVVLVALVLIFHVFLLYNIFGSHINIDSMYPMPVWLGFFSGTVFAISNKYPVVYWLAFLGLTLLDTYFDYAFACVGVVSDFPLTVASVVMLMYLCVIYSIRLCSLLPNLDPVYFPILHAAIMLISISHFPYATYIAGYGAMIGTLMYMFAVLLQ